MSNDKKITIQIQDSIAVKQAIFEDQAIITSVGKISQKLIHILKNHHTLFFAGNGGSFCDALHLAAEFVNRFLIDRNPLPAIALGTNGSVLTSISNDYTFQDVFSRELAALGKKGDLFIALSTSGNSPNILNAIKEANKIGIEVIGFTGKSGGSMQSLCDCLRVPSDDTPRIQEAHIMIGHIICQIVEEQLFSKD